jgi:ATP-dependent RNA helicase DeaD
VLDEADEMLDMGFAEELEAILDAAPSTRQTVLFSATMPSRIDAIAHRRLNDPVRIEIERARSDEGTAPAVRQVAYLAPRSHRAAALARVLEIEAPDAAIVFCRTRGDVDELTDVLTGRGYRADALHGGMGQEQRDRSMGRLKSGLVSLLVATDVAARGIDVDHLTHVVNFDVPQTGEAYVHRIGRVGRAGRAGVAITLGGPKDHRKLHRLADHTGHPIEILPVPSVAELVARRRATTRDEVARLVDGAGAYRDLAESLVAEGHDPIDVAAAAIRRAHEAVGRDRDEEEIPTAPVRSERRPERRAERGPGRRGERDRPHRPHRDRDLGSERGFQVEAGFVSLQFDLGRQGGVRPGDLVGAIANQAGIDGRDIGAIKINDRSSFVQVAHRHAGKVVTHLDGATIRNRQVRVRRAK